MDYVGFDGEQFRNFRDVQDERPLHMLNLVKFHETVTYPDGTVMSGRTPIAITGVKAPLFSRPLGGALFGVGNNWPC